MLFPEELCYTVVPSLQRPPVLERYSGLIRRVASHLLHGRVVCGVRV